MKPNRLFLLLAGALLVAWTRPGVSGDAFFPDDKDSPEKTIPEDIQKLRFGMMDEPADAAKRLGGVKDKSLLRTFNVVKSLALTLNDPAQNDFMVKRECARSLVRIVKGVDPDANREVAEALTSYAMTGAHMQTRVECLRGLGALLSADRREDQTTIIQLGNQVLSGKSVPPPLVQATLMAWGDWASGLPRGDRVGALALVTPHLSSPQPTVKEAAFYALSRYLRYVDPDNVQVNAMKNAFNDAAAKYETQAYAARALGAMMMRGTNIAQLYGSPEKDLIPILKRDLRGEGGKKLFQETIAALAYLATPAAADAIIELYNRSTPAIDGKDNPELRADCVSALGYYIMMQGRGTGPGSAAMPKVIAKLLGTEGADPKTITAEQYGEILNDSNPMVVERAMRALQRLSGTRHSCFEACRALTALLPDENPDQNQENARLNPKLADQAADALMVLTDQAFGLDKRRWFEWIMANEAKLKNPR